MKSKYMFVFLSMIALLWCSALVGCQANAEPLERATNSALEKVVTPVLEKGITELAARAAHASGQVSAINPGYQVDGDVIVGTAVAWRMTLKLDGVSGNLSGSIQGDQAPDIKSEE